MKRKLSCLVRSTFLLMILGTSQVSQANSIFAILTQLDQWLPDNIHDQIQNEIDQMREDGFSMEEELLSAMTSDEMEEAFIALSPVLNPCMKRCYFFSRNLCRNGDNCHFLHDPNVDHKKALALKKARKKAARAFKQQQAQLESTTQASSTHAPVTHNPASAKKRYYTHNKVRRNWCCQQNQADDHCSTTQASSTQSFAHSAAWGAINSVLAPQPIPLSVPFLSPNGQIDHVDLTYNSNTGLYLANYFGLVWAWSQMTGFFVWPM